MSVDTDCAYCHGMSAKSKCGRCLVVSYCNAECQRSDWKRHKKECKVPSTNAAPLIIDGKSCLFCHQVPAKSKCSRCETVYYCGAECQRSDWKRHKNDCEKYLEMGMSSAVKECKGILKQGVASDDMRLISACTLGRVGTARQLLAEGADINRENNGYTALILSIQHGHLLLAQELIAAGAHVNHANKNGSFPLFYACQSHHTEIVRLLIGAGAKVDCADKRGFTSLIMASQLGHADVVQLLIGAGAKVDCANNDGVTSLIVASGNGHVDVVRLLIGAGADVNFASKASTSLMLASQNGHVEVAQLLIGAGADVNFFASEASTSLMLASQNGHVEVVQLLIGAGADILYSAPSGPHAGFTAVDVASARKHEALVRLLLRALSSYL